MSRLMHSIWGLYHYPRYLERWRDDEIGELEDELSNLLSKVRKQRTDARAWREELGSGGTGPAERMRSIAEWRVDDVLRPEVAKAFGWSGSMETVLAQSKHSKAVVGLLEEVGDNVYELPMFRPEFCEALLEALDDASPDPVDGDAMPRLNLDHLGFSWIADVMLIVAKSVARVAYGGVALDWRHAYALEYSHDGQRNALVPHTDDSELTLNVVLDDRYQGGRLLVGGIRGQANENDDSAAYALEDRSVGNALCHIGRHLHAVEKVTEGKRRVLICWTRAKGTVRSTVCPCCWMNRRFGDTQTGDCICGPAWNSNLR